MIGKVIGGLLSDSTAIQSKVSDRIFPYSIDEEANLPAITYKVNSSVPEYTKSGLEYDTTNVEVVVFSESYLDCLTIAQYVRSTLGLYKGTYTDSGTEVIQSRVASITEGFDFTANVYFLKTTFTIKQKTIL